MLLLVLVHILLVLIEVRILVAVAPIGSSTDIRIGRLLPSMVKSILSMLLVVLFLLHESLRGLLVELMFNLIDAVNVWYVISLLVRLPRV